MTSPNASATVGVVIVSWNVAPLLAACLRSLRLSSIPLRVVVVDNASADSSAAMLRREFPEVQLLAAGENLGFTRANNRGFRALGLRLGDDSPVDDSPGNDSPVDDSPVDDSPLAAVAGDLYPPPFVLMLNPDTEVDPDSIAQLVDYLQAHPRAGLVGPALVYGDGSPQISARRFPSPLIGLLESTPIGWSLPRWGAIRRFELADRAADLAGPVDWIGGAAILARREALEAAGGFDEGFFMYAEELDLCRRLADLDWATHISPAARVVHHEAKSSGQVPGRRHLLFHRSRVRYFRKHHGRLAAEIVRLGILAQYVGVLLLEAAKGLLGHKRELRRARVRAYAELLRDGLG